MNVIVNTPDKGAYERAEAHWNAVAKPLYSLGLLEKMVCGIAAIRGTENVTIAKKAALVFCADHGVVEEGVTQTDSGVTALVAKSIAMGNGNVNLMTDADVFCVDMGIATDVNVPGIAVKKQTYGSGNIAKGPAMSRAQAENAINAGIESVGELKDAGYDIIAVGEMGIGNTTPTACITSVLLGVPPEITTGRGAGLSDKGLAAKISAVKRAIDVNRPDSRDAVDVLSKVGGYDIAGLTGAFLGGMVHRVPIVIDGVISMAAALLAVRICPECRHFMLPSHMSSEPSGKLLAEAIDIKPVIDAKMALGEGTGAVCLFPLLEAALRVYNGTHTFDSLGMNAYTPQEDNR